MKGIFWRGGFTLKFFSCCESFMFNLLADVNSDDCADGLANLDLNDGHDHHKMDKEGVTVSTRYSSYSNHLLPEVICEPLYDCVSCLQEPLVPYSDTSSTTRYTISYLLRLFMAEEKLSGHNKYECEKCCAPDNKKVSPELSLVFIEARVLLCFS